MMNEIFEIEVMARFRVRTDDIERTRHMLQFPEFPDLMDDDAVEFLDGTTKWEKITK